jgi:dihydrofolate reductase
MGAFWPAFGAHEPRCSVGARDVGGDSVSRVVYWMSVSLDGYVATRDGKIDFTAPDEELARFMNESARKLGAFFHGRRMYEEMASVWPTADQNPALSEDSREFGRIWMRTPKVVFSKMLRHVDHNSRLAEEDAPAEVAKWKQKVDGDLGLGGSTLAVTFMKLGLIDEFRLFVRPIVLGGGKPYFAELDRPINLRLVETRAFPGGAVLLRYQRSAPL